MWRRTLDAVKSKLGWNKNADWILTDRTQFTEPAQKGRPLQLVIGLDFGTAFTKVVIGEHRVRYAVPFAPYASEKNPFLLPSALAEIGNGGECSLGLSANAGRRIDDLKMRLLGGDASTETQTLCAAFLALVLRFTRGWLLDTQNRPYADRPIVWLLNVGLPTHSYHDGKLVEVYQKILNVAWTVSVLPGPVSLKRVEFYVNQDKIDPTPLPPQYRERLLDSTYLATFPEFAAQLVGYVRSPRRREGLHALVDIGAGTVDFTTFNVWRKQDGEDIFPIYGRDVQRLGTRFLIQHRLGKGSPNSEWVPSPYEDVPADRLFETKLSLPPGALHEIDKPFRDDVGDLIRDKLVYTRQRRDPLSPHWGLGVPTFLCGGGAHVACYTEVIQRFEAERPPFKITFTSLPTPDDLIAPRMPQGTYDRLSVAYGLSLTPDDIGRIYRAEETQDFTEDEARRQQTPDDQPPPLTDRDVWT